MVWKYGLGPFHLQIDVDSHRSFTVRVGEFAFILVHNALKEPFSRLFDLACLSSVELRSLKQSHRLASKVLTSLSAYLSTCHFKRGMGCGERHGENEDYLRRVNEKVLEMYGELSARAVID